VPIVSGNSNATVIEGVDGDFVAMDDFLYSEPTPSAVPEPTTLLPFGTTMAGRASALETAQAKLAERTRRGSHNSSPSGDCRACREHPVLSSVPR
jgi:hypothetical protein